MGQFKKVVAVTLSAILCTVAIGANVNAETIDSTVRSTTGGTDGSVNINLTATKEAFTAATAGYNGYKYGVKAALFPTMCLADAWEMEADFNTKTTTTTKNGVMMDSNSCYVYDSLTQASSQYISGEFVAYATSSEYGNTAIYLNVTY